MLAFDRTPSPPPGIIERPQTPEDQLRLLKDQFLASLNFEIRTPLSGILGMMDLLLEETLTPEQREYVAASRDCAQNLMEMLSTTLELSALTGGNVKLDVAEFDVGRSLKSLVAEYRTQARSKGLRLAFREDSTLPPVVVGDEVRLRQLVALLINNAIKFTHQGEIEVTAQAENSAPDRIRLLIAVQDSGVGIPHEQLHRIFDSFHQVQAGLSRRYSGLGVGLALARKLTELLGGEITVESKLEQGSKFTITVPLHLPADSVVPLMPGRHEHRRRRILVVDDNEVARRVMMHVLNKGGYTAVCASSGQEAIELAATQTFDAVFMDLQMPDLNGYDTTAILRRIPGFEKTPVFALTANATDDHRAMCREAGIKGFFTKPVAVDELLGMLDDLFRAETEAH